MTELVRGSLNLNDLRRIKEEGHNELFNNLPLFARDFNVDVDRASTIDISRRIGAGFQGTVYAVLGQDDRVVKLLKLKNPNQVTDNEIIIATCSVYASNIGIGPVVHGPPFVTPDGKYVAIIMDRVTMYEPRSPDVDEMTMLFERMINNHFMTYDMQFAKRPTTGEIIIVDFGVSGFYNTNYETLKAAINNDVFYLNYRILHEHFKNVFATMEPESVTTTTGGKKKKTKKRTRRHRRNVKNGRKNRKTYRKY